MAIVRIAGDGVTFGHACRRVFDADGRWFCVVW